MIMKKYEDVINYCIKEAKNIPMGIKFTLPDLFKKYEWDNMKVDKNNKGLLGKEFNRIVNTGKLSGLIKDLGIKREDTNTVNKRDKNYIRELYKKI